MLIQKNILYLKRLCKVFATIAKVPIEQKDIEPRMKLFPLELSPERMQRQC